MDCVAVKFGGSNVVGCGQILFSPGDAVCRCDGLNCWRAWIGGLRMTVLNYVRL